LLGVISKIKQNSSDMNEIILVPCDAGYVQNCTGSYCAHVMAQLLYEITLAQRDRVPRDRPTPMIPRAQASNLGQSKIPSNLCQTK
jgi:hypothetical protein